MCFSVELPFSNNSTDTKEINMEYLVFGKGFYLQERRRLVLKITGKGKFVQFIKLSLPSFIVTKNVI